MAFTFRVLGIGLLLSLSGTSGAGERPGRLEAVKDKLIDSAAAKGRDMLVRLKEAAPVIKEAGYAMGQVHLEIDLVPAVSVEFIRKNRIDEAAMKALLEEHKEHKTLSTVLRGLFLANKLDVLGYRMEKVTVRIPPRTTVTLTPE